MEAQRGKQNGLLWLAAGCVSLYLSIKLLHYSLKEHAATVGAVERPKATASAQRADVGRTASEVRRGKARKSATQKPEDQIDIETLETLISHPSYDIRKAAQEIAVSRFNSSRPARRYMQSMLHSRDPIDRDQAIGVVNSGILNVDPMLGLNPVPSFDLSDYTSEGPNRDVTPPTYEELEVEGRSQVVLQVDETEAQLIDGLAELLTQPGIEFYNLGEVADPGEPDLQTLLDRAAASVAESAPTGVGGERRRRNREAMALGNEEDGLEILEINE